MGRLIFTLKNEHDIHFIADYEKRHLFFVGHCLTS